jgi:hypothetical protein
MVAPGWVVVDRRVIGTPVVRKGRLGRFAACYPGWPELGAVHAWTRTGALRKLIDLACNVPPLR